jgi:hypothetical protein
VGDHAHVEAERPPPYDALGQGDGYWLWYYKGIGQPWAPMGVYPYPPPETDGNIGSLELSEAVPLLGLDSTRVLRQMSQLTRLRDSIEDLVGDLFT